MRAPQRRSPRHREVGSSDSAAPAHQRQFTAGGRAALDGERKRKGVIWRRPTAPILMGPRSQGLEGHLVPAVSRSQELAEQSERMGTVGPAAVMAAGTRVTPAREELESRKLVVWCRGTLPLLTESYRRLQEKLGTQYSALVAKVRNHGRLPFRRLEILCPSTQSRETLLTILQRSPLGLAGEVCLRGRTMEERRLARLTRERTSETVRSVPSDSQPRPSQSGTGGWRTVNGRRRGTRARRAATAMRARATLSSRMAAQSERLLACVNRFAPLAADFCPLGDSDSGAAVGLGEEVRSASQAGDSAVNRGTRYRPLTFGSLNVDGLSPLLPALWKAAQLPRVDFVGLVETYRSSDGHSSVRFPDYALFETPMAPGTKRGVKVDPDSHGVGVLVRNEWIDLVSLLHPTPKYRDCCWIRVRKDVEVNQPIMSGPKWHGHRRVLLQKELWFGAYYFAPSLSDEALLDAVQELTELLRRADSVGAEVVLAGDFNCNLRQQGDPLRHRTAYPTRREQILWDLMALNGLTSLHVIAPSKPLLTVCKGGVPCNMRDYCLVQAAGLSQWKSLQVHADADLDSDHFLITAKHCSLLRQLSGEEAVAGNSVVEGVSTHPGWRVGVLRCMRPEPRGREATDKIRAGLCARGLRTPGIAGGDTGTGRPSVDEASDGSYEGWYAKVTEVLDETLGRNDRRRRRRAVPVWMTEDVWKAIRARRSAHAAFRIAINAGESDERLSELWASYLRRKTECTEATLKARRECWLSFMQDIDELPRGSRDFWRALERSRGGSSHTRWGAVRGQDGSLVYPQQPGYLERWRGYYSQLCNGTVGDVPLTPHQAEVARAVQDGEVFTEPVGGDELSELNSPITVKEISEALESLPNCKAAGPDGLANEVLKALGPEAFVGVFAGIWEREESPQQWGQAIIHPLPKTGDMSDLGNTRGISLMSCACKLFGRVLNARLTRFLEAKKYLAPEQGGFRSQRECPEQVFVLYETLLRRRAEDKETHLAFIDFSKAYDRVWRDGLWWKMARAGVRGKMLRMLRALYANTEATVRVNGRYSDYFSLDQGVRQGDVLSPLLFNVYINDLLDEIKRRGLGVLVPGVERDSPFTAPVRLAGLLWADDVVLLAKSPEQLQEALDLVADWCVQWKMMVNGGKCGVMVVAKDQQAAVTALAGRSFTIGPESIPLVQEYRYLGVRLTADLSWGTEIKCRAEALRKAIFSKARILRNRELSPDVRLRYVESVILPTALWGSEFWLSDKRAAISAEGTLGAALRMVFGLGGKASRVALAWEAGLVPLHMLAAKARVRLLLKWSGLDLTQVPSGIWVARLLSSIRAFKSKTWTWVKMTVNAGKWIGLDLKNVLVRGRIDPIGDLRECSRLAALQYYRAWAQSRPVRDREPSSLRALVLSLHVSDSTLRRAEYLRAPGASVGSCVLAGLRTGSLFFNDRISKFAPDHGKSCTACGAAVETMEHFLSECPRYESERSQWFAEWRATARSLDSPFPDPLTPAGACRLALEESPAFLKSATPDVLARAHRTRAASLRAMWRARCTLCVSLGRSSRAQADGVA